MYIDKLITGDDKPLSVFHELTTSPVGYTIARAAKIIGISKQAIDQAIRKDALQATRIYIQAPSGPKLLSTEVDRESVHEYAFARSGRERIPQGFRATQKPLPF